ncbi:hypothetical protein V6N11_024448 [Hibiscus sabdariffa]|uniref:BED-type domain-containing protein n=1 Tax=Hibiscus sabdariffa TaxID=183260 RepID=A0ABR2QM48_9ROSI
MSESQGQGTQSSQSSSPSKVIGPTLTRNESIRKQQQPRASCWSHFSKYVTEDGQKRARCNHCDTTYTMETGGSTTSLNNHMKVCLQKPKGNTSDLKQSELSFANVGDGPENIVSMASKMKDKYNKYWGDATNINFMVYLAIILDPRRKMGYNDFSLMLPVRL